VVKLRKENPILVYGKYTLLDKDNPKIYAYTRELNGEKILVLLNFSKEKTSFALNGMKLTGKSWINNYSSEDSNKEAVDLQPYQAIVYKIE
jgi:oligo-1,6-glucosidase